MKWLITAILCIGIGAPCWSVITVSPGCTGAGNVGVSATCSFDSTGCTLMVVGATSYRNGFPCAFSDSNSNGWKELTLQDSPNQNDTVIYYSSNPIVGVGDTFTFGGAVCYPAFSVLCIKGSASNPFDQENGSAADSGGTAQPGPVTPTQDNEFIITTIGSGSNIWPLTIDSGFTVSTYTATNSGGGNYGEVTAYLIQTTAGTVNPTWTNPDNSQSVVPVIATFKASANATGKGNMFEIFQ